MAQVGYSPVPEREPEGGVRVNADPNAFGGAIAGALQRGGSDLERGADDLASAAIHKQDLTNELYANDANTQAMQKLTDRYGEFAKLEGRAAHDALPAFKQDVLTIYKDTLDAAPNDASKALLSRSMRYVGDSYLRYGQNHANEQWKAWADRSAIARSRELGNQAALAINNPSQMETFLNGSDDEIRKLYEQRGWDSEAINSEVRKNRGGNLRGIIETLANDDPVAAMSLFQNYRNQIDADNALKIYNKLRPAVIQESARSIGDEVLGRNDTGDVTSRILKIEGAGKNPSSSAEGVGQFVNSTWLDVVKRNRPDLAAGKTDQQILALRSDPVLGREMTEAYRSENTEVLKKNGIEATPGNQYLAHFLGPQGAVKVLSAPFGTPLSQLLDQKAIDANPRLLGGGRTVADLATWADAKMSGRGPVADRTVVFTNANRRLDEIGAGPALRTATLSYLTGEMSRVESETALEKQTVKGLVDSDIRSIAATGQGVGDLDPLRVEYALGPAAADRWHNEREDASALWSATRDMPSLSEREMYQRLEAVAPKPGDRQYARQSDVYDKAQTVAQGILKQRNEDPAGAVSLDPTVKAAQAAVKANDAESYQALVQARLAVQERAGIPDENQSPITKAEAVQLSTPLRRMLPGQERGTLMEMAENFKNLFGPYADQAFEYALRVHHVEAKTARMAASIMRKLSLGQLPNAEETRGVDQAAELAAADHAVGSGSDAASNAPFDQGKLQQQIEAGAAPEVKREPGLTAPAKAITALRQNPQLADEFDAKYGIGSARKILGNYPIGATDAPAATAPRQPVEQREPPPLLRPPHVLLQDAWKMLPETKGFGIKLKPPHEMLQDAWKKIRGGS